MPHTARQVADTFPLQRVGIAGNPNALMYSLGYKFIYVSGFSVNKTNFYNDNDSHSWSLIKVNNKWLPFDATCGIFTGKLPVSHVFLSYFMKKANKNGSDNVEIREAQFHGKFIG